MLWLHAQGLLPMEPHQAYGSLFAKGTGHFDVEVDWSNETVGVNLGERPHQRRRRRRTQEPPQLRARRPGPDAGRGRSPARLMALRPGSYWRYAAPAGTTSRVPGRFDPRAPPRRIRGPPAVERAAAPDAGQRRRGSARPLTSAALLAGLPARRPGAGLSPAARVLRGAV
ncbi:unnamed protein product [Prorocentrum cordatum]|uniref:Uncharacterized protein n=1 Tax=Prorocentrum cordatum TaxID=2364126 RepID=A0ABN9X757_9DINO|nr:unnamed protein product [Polarella glacialis]